MHWADYHQKGERGSLGTIEVRVVSLFVLRLHRKVMIELKGQLQIQL